MKRTEPTQVLHVMDAYFERMGATEKINQVRIMLQWKAMMGPVIVRKTTQLSVKNKVLYVSLSSPALRNELLYKREQLVRSLNNYVGSDVIEDIVFQ